MPQIETRCYYSLSVPALLILAMAQSPVSEAERGSWVNCAPRLLLDLGRFSGQDGHFFAGIEYQYWSDKFGAGISGEQVLQAQLKFAF